MFMRSRFWHQPATFCHASCPQIAFATARSSCFVLSSALSFDTRSFMSLPTMHPMANFELQAAYHVFSAACDLPPATYYEWVYLCVCVCVLIHPYPHPTSTPYLYSM